MKSGSVSPQANPLVGEVIAVNEKGNSAIEEGTVVLSGEGAAVADLKSYQVGDEIEMNFSFVEEEWNYVDFAIGGHYSIVQNGEPMELDYTGDAAAAFGTAAPRTGVGMTKDGKLVIVATDGRGSVSGRGFTANEMAHYMAEDLNCENAILLDGGGSTEMVTMSGGTVNIRNTPSDGSERSVGNGLFLVKLDEPRAPGTEPTAPQGPGGGAGQPDALRSEQRGGEKRYGGVRRRRPEGDGDIRKRHPHLPGQQGI